MGNLLQLLAGNLFLPGIGFLVDKLGIFHHVAGAEEQDAAAGQSVAPGTPGFLVITLNVLGQVVVQDEANVRFVDPHAKGNRGANDRDLIPQKEVLVAGSLAGAQAGVISFGVNAVSTQPGGEQIGGFACLAIDNSRLSSVSSNKNGIIWS